MTKIELQLQTDPRVRIVVTDPVQARDLLQHGWRRVQATVQPKAETGAKK